MLTLLMAELLRTNLSLSPGNCMLRPPVLGRCHPQPQESFDRR